MQEALGTPEKQGSAFYTESRIHAVDGATLFVRRWAPAEGDIKAQLLILHGYMDHGGRYREVAHHLCEAGIACVAPDLRGHGRSSGRRGYVDRFEEYLDDVQAALGTLDDSAPTFMLGHSHGGLVALDMVVNRQPPLAGLVVTNPFLAQTHAPPPAKLWVGRLAGKYLPQLSLPSGLKSQELTHDPILVEAHRRDPLVFGNANAGWFREATGAQTRVRALRRLTTPLLYVYSDRDPVASPAANRSLAEQIACDDKRVVVRQNELHEVLNEMNRAELHSLIARWIIGHRPNS